jgi:hypothetical protein
MQMQENGHAATQMICNVITPTEKKNDTKIY